MSNHDCVESSGRVQTAAMVTDGVARRRRPGGGVLVVAVVR